MGGEKTIPYLTTKRLGSIVQCGIDAGIVH
jgi:hypothetical protein